MQYKFENYRDPEFPVYCSVQEGKGQLVKPHYHNALELLWVVRGEGELLINARKRTVSEGIWFLPPGSIHSLYSHREDTQIRGVVFEMNLFHDHSLPPFAAEILSPVNVTDDPITGEEKMALQTQLTELHRSYWEATPYTKMELLSGLYRVLAILVRHYAGSRELKAVHSRIQPAIEYLQKHYSKKIKLSELSSLLHLCEDHVIRLFKDCTGKTPIRFLTDLRIENAMKLLARSPLPVAEIAAATGFSDPAHMCKVFKKTIGMTPAQYRKTRNR